MRHSTRTLSTVRLALLLAAILAAPSAGSAQSQLHLATPIPGLAEAGPLAGFQRVRGPTCKQMRDCRSAVMLWCSGYYRADGDGDGIPCENVCHSRRQVEAILKEIGCKL